MKKTKNPQDLKTIDELINYAKSMADQASKDSAKHMDSAIDYWHGHAIGKDHAWSEIFYIAQNVAKNLIKDKDSIDEKLEKLLSKILNDISLKWAENRQGGNHSRLAFQDGKDRGYFDSINIIKKYKHRIAANGDELPKGFMLDELHGIEMSVDNFFKYIREGIYFVSPDPYKKEKTVPEIFALLEEDLRNAMEYVRDDLNTSPSKYELGKISGLSTALTRLRKVLEVYQVKDGDKFSDGFTVAHNTEIDHLRDLVTRLEHESSVAKGAYNVNPSSYLDGEVDGLRKAIMFVERILDKQIDKQNKQINDYVKKQDVIELIKNTVDVLSAQHDASTGFYEKTTKQRELYVINSLLEEIKKM